MERKVRGEDGIEWACVQAFAGVANTTGSEVADEAVGHATNPDGKVPVVCTPSREEPTIRLELPLGWAARLSDEDLLHAIAQARIGG